MVRLAVILVKIDCGTRTPTVAQTSLITAKSVISCNLLRPAVQRHSHQRLAGRLAYRTLASVGLDELTQLIDRHPRELAFGFLDGLFQRQIFLENGVASAQGFQFGQHLLAERGAAADRKST